MGKSRRRSRQTNSSGGEYPRTSDMPLPESTSTVTMEPEANPGERDTLPQNEEKAREELNNLYVDVIEADMNRSTAWGAYYDQQDRVGRLQEQVDALGDTRGTASSQIRKNLRDAQNKLNEMREFAQERQREFDEMNRRIYVLETFGDRTPT